MDVLGFLHNMADLDAVHPWMGHDLFCRPPQLGVGLQHGANQRSTLFRREVGNCRWSSRSSRVGRVTGICIGGVHGVGRLCDPPRHLLEVETIIDDGASPDVDQTRVVGCPRTTNALKECLHEKATPCLRFPKNCSGAIYGSLPQRPVDIWTVVSQGNLYTVEAP